ncbi:hypothetical protein DPM13_16380 [Paracoccus mutanolyticus]|uniref:Uncharacterized protein n=1 Tax=Paracoccus mutanolyticus TaxID=1499308 RepID=A0ABM6WTJ8_9RHOB|nr:hypothetical protein [Paracoccus mutanolyticus]AWX93996.1 hypothetical protein DPM13_16380 [Paracoccus mutanolyticus]
MIKKLATATAFCALMAGTVQAETIGRRDNSPHGRCRLGVGHRSLVPFTSIPESEVRARLTRARLGSPLSKVSRWPSTPVLHRMDLGR